MNDDHGANHGTGHGADAGVRQFTVGHDDEGARLDRWFKRHLPQIGFAMISRWARTGQIRVDGKRAKPEDRLSAGQVVRVPPGGEAPDRAARVRVPLTEEELERADAMVLHRDRAAIVINKPPGLATQGGTGTEMHVDRLLDAYVTSERAPRPRLVHRLDKDTSGVLLTAATPGSAAFFSKRFSGRSARKVYWALVVGVPDIAQGMIDLPIGKQPGSGGEKMMPDEEGQPAKTRYRMVDRAGNSAAWIELEPLTGRTHQLRVHMAAIGHPIVGDGKYGGQMAFLTGSISRKMHLHARRLIIDHPDGVPLDVTAPLPEHFAASMEQLGFDEGMSDAAPEEGRGPPTREDEKQAAKRHAKTYRKERRGERRTRTTGAPRAGARPVGSKPAGARRPAAKKTESSVAGGPSLAGGKPGAKPAGRTATGRTANGKPGGAKPASARTASARSASGKPGGAKPDGKLSSGKSGDRKPSGSRPGSDRPVGAKPSGGKPGGGRTGGGKPSGGKPSGGKPSGSKPSGGRPTGGSKRP